MSEKGVCYVPSRLCTEVSQHQNTRKRNNHKKIMMMNSKSLLILSYITFTVVFLCGSFKLGFCREFGVVSLKNFGGIRDFKFSPEIESVARFAVEEHNKRENTLLRFGKVLTAKEQAVAGKIYHLTLEAIDAGMETVYEAKVWVKPWMNFKQLQEFKRVMDISNFRISDLPIVRYVLGWHKIPTHDPEVQNAAKHAVSAIQQRSNCLIPYKLLEILQAETEVVKDFVKYKLLLKLKSGTMEENMKVVIRRAVNGSFFLNLFEHFDH